MISGALCSMSSVRVRPLRRLRRDVPNAANLPSVDRDGFWPSVVAATPDNGIPDHQIASLTITGQQVVRQELGD